MRAITVIRILAKNSLFISLLLPSAQNRAIKPSRF
jgi:hypothetical protein